MMTVPVEEQTVDVKTDVRTEKAMGDGSGGPGDASRSQVASNAPEVRSGGAQGPHCPPKELPAHKPSGL